ncbi:MAG: helix-turn-helix domain-containing protein, partial [Nanoarchaeota archaeon]
VSATSEPIDDLLKKNSLLDPFYWRIAAYTMTLPPLRERYEDIVPLANLFLNRLVREYNLPNVSIHPATIEKMLSYAWPGNVRELKSQIQVAVIKSKDNEILPEHLVLKKGASNPNNIFRSLEEQEKDIVLAVLERARYNVKYATEILDIGRQTLYNKLEKWNMSHLLTENSRWRRKRGTVSRLKAQSTIPTKY